MTTLAPQMNQPKIGARLRLLKRVNATVAGDIHKIVDIKGLAAQEGLTERGTLRIMTDLVSFGLLTVVHLHGVKIIPKAVRFLVA